MPGVRRVLVVGAGIGGLATAIGLRAAGIEAVVFERRAAPSRLLTGGGFVLWHNAFLALRRLGLDERVAAAGAPMSFHEFRSDRGRPLARWAIDPRTERIGAPACALRRAALHQILMDAAGDCVRLGARLVGFDQASSTVTAHFDDGGRERGDVLVGADGLRSTVRTMLRRGHEIPPRYAGYTAWQAITRLRDERVPAGTFFNLWGRRGLRFLYCRLNDDEVYWDAITSGATADRFDLMRYSKRDVLAHHYRDWPQPVTDLIRGAEENAILPIAIFDRPPGGAWGSGRVTLLGDAAHPMTLNLSQGAGQAIESAVVLARTLAGCDGDVPRALAGYEARRRDRTAGMVRTAWRIGMLGRVRGPVGCALREVFMRATFGSLGSRKCYRLIEGVQF